MKSIYENSSERIRLAREIAQEGIVLLKNADGMLPFGKEKVAVFGRTQVDTIKCGTGSAFCESDYCVSVLEGMENAGIAVDAVLAEKYREWCGKNTISTYGVWGSGAHIMPEMPLCRDDVRDAALRAEKAVFVIGRTAGENDDSSPIDGDFRLSHEEKELLENIKEYFDKIAVIVNSGNVIDLSFTECERIKSVVLLGLPGMEGGNALGDILSGRISPSAKLTDTIARQYSDYPASGYFGRKAGLVQHYYEDIFVGYRYFETLPHAKEKILYPFGFGLSYTEFEKTPESFSCDGETVTACIKVKNAGESFAGKETVMLYSSSPAEARAPRYELRAFEKTKLLAPGEEQTLRLSFPVKEMASFDDTGAMGKKDCWTLVKGVYGVYFGNSVSELAPAGEWENESTVFLKECVNIPTELEKRLTPDGDFEAVDAMPYDTLRGLPIGPMARLTVDADEYSEPFVYEEEACELRREYFGDLENITEYHLNITAGGLYTLRLRADSVPVKAMINGIKIASLESYFEDGGSAIILSPGTNVFAFKGEEASPLVSFEFVKEDETVFVKAEGSSLLECGKFTECALFVISREFEDANGLISHGRGLFRMHTPGRYAMYKLEVEKAGYYDITLRYSTYHDTRDLAKTYSFMVSNVTQEIEHVTLYKTAEEDSPFSFRTSEPIRLALPAGEAYLKVVSMTKHTPHLAYMEITPSTRDVCLENDDVYHSDEFNNVPLEHNDITFGYFPRKELPAALGEYDFRNVLSGKLSLDDFVRDLSDEELAALTCGNKNGHIGYSSKRGIPEAYWSDGPVGYRQNYTVTVYPSGTTIASTWNKELSYEFGKSIGVEGTLHNVDVWLAPAMNIHRDPCCGRNFEYLSEDPYITGAIVSEIVNGVEESNVATTIKHFAANNTEYQRMKSNSIVSARALREIYMKAFEIAVDRSQPMAIMTSYNLINGTKVSENPIFVNDVLRKEFAFEGLVMSDFANDSDHVRELAATQDLKMHYGDPRTVCKNLADGALSRETVRECVKRVLELLMKTVCKNSEI